MAARHQTVHRITVQSTLPSNDNKRQQLPSFFIAHLRLASSLQAVHDPLPDPSRICNVLQEHRVFIDTRDAERLRADDPSR